MPTNRRFRTIAEAARFACFDVAHPRDPGEWRFQGAIAHRSHDIDMILSRGMGFRAVDVWYVDNRDDTLLQITVVPGGAPKNEGGDVEMIELQGVDAEYRTRFSTASPNAVIVRWEAGGNGFHAIAHLTPEFTREELLRVLESIR